MSVVELKKHNMEIYNKLKEGFNTKNHIGVVQATGTGKSYIVAKCVEDMEFQKVLFLSPSNEIIDQFKETFPKLSSSITFMTYKKLSLVEDVNHFFEINNFDFIVLDEYHRCGARTWIRNIKKLLNHYKDSKVVGVTATHLRFLDSCRNMTRELFNSEPLVEVSLLEAIDNDILPKPKYIVSHYDTEDKVKEANSNLKELEQEVSNEDIRRILYNLDKVYNIEEILDKHIEDERKFIVFCSNINHAKEVEFMTNRWFNKIGYSTASYRAYYDEGINRSNIQYSLDKFKNDTSQNNEIKLLFVVDIMNEGIHMDGVDGLIFLRKTKSPIIFFQQMGRVLSSGKNKSPLIFDFVKNISGLSFGEEKIGSRTIVDKKEYDGEIPSLDDYVEMIDYSIDIDNILSDINKLSFKATWCSFLGDLKDYIYINNNLNIPSTHKLYRRCLNLRKRYHEGTLEEYKIKDLNSLNFDFGAKSIEGDLWEIMYLRLLDYVKEYGHANVPITYKDKQLATWVRTQRKYRDTLSEYRKEKLLACGFNFEFANSRNEKQWEEMFNKLLEFKEKFGHVNVSSRYEDKTLANWVNSQRKAYKANKLAQHRYDKLVGIGFKLSK